MSKKRRVGDRRPAPSRRAFLVAGGASLVGGTTLMSRLLKAQAHPSVDGLPIRPPSAAPNEADFMALCARCGLCGTVCENGCIRFFGLDETRWGALTPYLDTRHRSCTLCMRCTNICPTGALTPIKDELPIIAKTVKMGVAKVDSDRCISYLGRVCGYCHDACPLPGKAIRLAPPALPVILDGCVGCGRCVECCPQNPTAIWIEREESV